MEKLLPFSQQRRYELKSPEVGLMPFRSPLRPLSRWVFVRFCPLEGILGAEMGAGEEPQLLQDPIELLPRGRVPSEQLFGPREHRVALDDLTLRAF